MKKLLSLAVLGAALLTGQVYAACSNPAGTAGQTRYATNYSMMVFCDGTNWVSMAGGVSVTIGGTTNTPGGANTQIQFNSGGSSFGGDAGLTWNTGTSTLTATNLTATVVTATTLGGTLSTAAQPNITSVGALTGLTVNGTITATTVTATTVTATNVYAGTVSASALYINGVAVNGGSSGDRIASGTTVSSQMVMNGGSTYVSLSTGATTWGYLSSATTWLPAIGANSISSSQVSATSVSASVAELAPTTFTNLVGGGGNIILSGSTVVSVTNSGAKGYAIGFAPGGTTAMVISGTGVGIGTAAPLVKLDVAGGNVANDFTTGGQIGLGWGAGGGTYRHRVTTTHDSASAAGNSLNFYLWNYGTDAVSALGTKHVMTLRGDGNVGIGTAAPSAPLHIKYSANNWLPHALILENTHASAQTALVFQVNGTSMGMIRSDYVGNLILEGKAGSGGSVYLGYTDLGAAQPTYTNNGAVGTFSDKRLKTNITSIDGKIALEKLAALRPVLFDWVNPELHDGKPAGGFIAQEVEKVLPHLVDRATCMGADCKLLPNGEKPYVLSLKPEFNAYVVGAIQELKVQNDALRAENGALKAENAGMKADIQALTSRLDKLEGGQR